MTPRDDRILDLWVGRQRRSQQFRDHFEGRWKENWKWYRNLKHTHRHRGQQWRSNRQIPDAFRVIETMVPQHIRGMFRNPQWFSVDAPTFPGQRYQRAVKSLLLRGWNKADGFTKTIEFVKYAQILGHGFVKTVWDVKLGEREITDLDFERGPNGEALDAKFIRRTVPHVRHNGPQVYIPDVFRLWPDPTGAESFYIESIDSSMDFLKTQNRAFDNKLYKNLTKVSKASASGSSQWNGYGAQSQHDDTLESLLEGIPRNDRKDPDHVELWQCWGYVPKSVADYSNEDQPTQWRLIVIANRETVIRDVPAPTPDHRPPYDSVPAIPVPQSYYGDSVLSYVGPLIDLRSEIENMRRDEVLLNIYKTYAVDADAEIIGQGMFKTPGGAMRIRPKIPGTPVNQSILEIQRSPVLGDAYRESAVKEDQILKTSGATDPFQGAAFGARTTATEVGLIADVGSGRFDLATMWIDEKYKKKVLERMFSLYQSRLTAPEIAEVAGQFAAQGEMDFTDLQTDVDIVVDSGKFGSLDQQKLQGLIQFYQLMLQNPQTAIWVDPAKFVDRMSYRIGIEDGDAILRSQDEVAEIQAQQEQQALIQAALAGDAGEGGVQ